MPADDRDDAAARARLAALQAEIDAAAPRRPVERAAPVIAPPRPRPETPPRRHRDEEDDGGIDTALAVAKGARLARQAKAELTRPRVEGEKSWIASGLLSLAFGPVGWLYAGAFRESIPAAFLYLLAAAILTKLPFFLLMPVMMVALPISAIGGVVYALQYNRNGKRTRLFDKDDPDASKSGSGRKKLGPG